MFDWFDLDHHETEEFRIEPIEHRMAVLMTMKTSPIDYSSNRRVEMDRRYSNVHDSMTTDPKVDFLFSTVSKIRREYF